MLYVESACRVGQLPRAPQGSKDVHLSVRRLSVAFLLDEKRIQHICWSLAALVDPLVSCSSMLGFNLSVAHLCLE